MTGLQSPRSYFTNLTVALLRDSNWYEINSYSQIEDMPYGKGSGCHFVNSSCYSYLKKELGRPHPYCTGAGGDYIPPSRWTMDNRSPYRCSADRSAVEACSLRHVNDVDLAKLKREGSVAGINHIRYYEKGYVSTDIWKSFCPTWKVDRGKIQATNGNNLDFDRTCIVKQKRNAYVNYNAETFGKDSLCFETSTKTG